MPIGYRVFDEATGFLILLSVVFAPWALGTVHESTIQVLNSIGFALGFCSVAKRLVAFKTGYRPTTWSSFLRNSSGERRTLDVWTSRLLKIAFGLSTGVLLYILLYLLNPRATFDQESLTFGYYESYVKWLPHTYDVVRTFDLFVMYASLWMGFWALIDWLDQPTQLERRLWRDRQVRSFWFPDSNALFHGRRLNCLLLVITVNTVLIGFILVLHRLSGDEKALWFYEPLFPNPASHSGPFVYRGNASAYLNLAWPTALFFGVLYHQKRLIHGDHRAGSNPSFLIFISLLIVLAGVFMSTSRTGSAIAGGIVLVFCLGLLLRAKRRMITGFTISIGVGLLVILGFVLDFSSTWKRFEFENPAGDTAVMSGRLETYKICAELLQENIVYGSGPGTFACRFQMYRKPKAEHWDNIGLQPWVAWAHCDPAETLITFGLVGTVLIALTLLCLTATPLVSWYGWDRAPPIWLIMVGLAGFCLHSLVDFPFQIYSLLHLFTVVVGILVSCRRRGVTWSADQPT